MPRDAAKDLVEIGRAVARDQGLRGLGRIRLAEEENHLGGFAGLERQRRLKRAARIESGAGPLGKRRRARRQRGRVGQRAVPAQELPPVAGPASLPSGQIGKRHPGAEGCVPGIAGQQRTGFGLDLGRDERRGCPPRRTQHPFDIGRDRKPPRPRRGVADRQARDLDRIEERNVLQEIERDTARLMLEPAVSLAVPDDIGRDFVPDRQRGRSPDLAAVLVAQEYRLARGIGHGIVRPGRKLVFAAVDRPGIAAALGRDLKTETRVGDHVHPRRRRRLPGAENRHILPSIRCKSAESVEELEARRRGLGWRRACLRQASRPSRRRRCRARIPNAVELVRQAAAASGQHHPGHGRKQGAGLARDQIGAQHEDRAARPVRADPQAGLAGPHHGLERGLKVLNIGRRPFVQDHQIDGELFHPPIFMGAQQLADDGDVLDLVDLNQNDGNVPGNALGPQRIRAGASPANGFGRRPHPRIGIKHVAREALKEARLVGIDAEIMKLHLRLGPGQRGRPFEGVGVAMLVDHIQHVGARGRGERPERDAHRLARLNPHMAPQRENGIQHGADGVGERPSVHRRDRRPDVAPAADETGPVGLDLGFSHRLALDHGKMGRPDLGFGRRLGAAASPGWRRFWRHTRSARIISTKAGCAASSAGGASTSSA